ncbi:hypothetical protein HOP50_05g36270 [Chloropicon primus]|uniref:EVE domain-containing protein n=1 Tax=Chloropicon primus TaxID=1764295 RepID=A0A5B8ML24_9CHLO|nr:hypothetical protein A3770_05p36170 [Chloropicon primus]UPR00313.1 hypothetical protein HOP50_05g36270 [Chloropicon primus]|eukprot:QDZ21099.1 hypothetical protein A3770_05p36170 [Chloropicon primus]
MGGGGFVVVKYPSLSQWKELVETGVWRSGSSKAHCQVGDVLFFTLTMSGHFQGAAEVQEVTRSEGDACMAWVHAGELSFAEARHLGVKTKDGGRVEGGAGPALLKLVKANGQRCELPKVKRRRTEDEDFDFSSSGHLGDLSYDRYVKLFDKFKAVSEKIGKVESLYDLSPSDKEEIAQGSGIL